MKVGVWQRRTWVCFGRVNVSDSGIDCAIELRVCILLAVLVAKRHRPVMPFGCANLINDSLVSFISKKRLRRQIKGTLQAKSNSMRAHPRQHSASQRECNMIELTNH
jgi:hypothetical protein